MTYSHRNGETEAPTVPGDYDFFGKRYGKHLGAKNANVTVAEFPPYGCAVQESYAVGFERYEGRWWGPK